MQFTQQSTPRGFTLVELLVVMVIVGLILGMVVFSAMPNPAKTLEEDGLRIARLLTLAGDEAQLRAKPILFEADRNGWRFSLQEGGVWKIYRDDPFRPAQWTSPLDAISAQQDFTANINSSSGIRFAIGREAVENSLRLHLRRGTYSVTVEGDGFGRYGATLNQAAASLNSMRTFAAR